jgi:glycerate-2-kinase
VRGLAFVTAFVAHAPDADPEEHRCLIETPKYRLHVAVVRDQAQAVEACRRLVKEEGVQSFVLCPGFTHGDVAEIAEVVGEGVGVNVARGDAPSNRVAMQVIAREWS